MYKESNFSFHTFVYFQGTNYCGSAENIRRPFAEILYNLVMGFVSIFDFINLKEGPTRLKHFFYYAVLTMEAGILMTLWYMKVLEKVSTFALKKQKSPSKIILLKFIYS